MPKPKNKTVGSCACPIKGCELIGEVRRIKNEGDFYIDCKVHGTIRNKGLHDYVLDNANLNGPTGSTVEEVEEKEPIINTDFDVSASNDDIEGVDVSELEIERAPVEYIDKKNNDEPKKKGGFFDFDL